MRRRVRPLASLSGSEVQIWHCRELWCRPAAVDSIRPLPSLGTSIRHKCSPKKQKEKKNHPKQHIPALSLSKAAYARVPWLPQQTGRSLLSRDCVFAARQPGPYTGLVPGRSKEERQGTEAGGCLDRESQLTANRSATTGYRQEHA